ncbi:MAG: carbohydrate ABC transporter permease [Treponema sp.]|jgi:ABC-type glycerol-3-phosphate transport system permease component|nr:carbohydrate ABC transporter permease [Treponema sp.]
MANGAVGMNKKSPVEYFIITLTYIFFVFFTLACVFPFYYLIINSISANDLSVKGSIMFYPRQIHFKNYTSVMKIPGLPIAALNSLARTVLGTGFTVLGSSFLGFMFTQKKLWARKFWYRFVVATMYFNAGLIPWYLTMMTLRLTNNFLAYIVPAIVQPFNIILIKTYIENTPMELQEAAEVDGAGIFYIYSRIILPISKPILATVAIFSAVGQWNAFMDTLILMTDSRLYTLQFVLYRYLSEARSLTTMIQASGGSLMDTIINAATQQTPSSVQMTIAVVVVIPILLVYPLFQRFFVKGIMIGAVKG